MTALVLFLVAMNPAAVAVSIPRSALLRAPTKAAFAATAAIAVVLAGCSGPLLDWLDLSTPTFRLATGAVLGLAAIRWVLIGAKPLATTNGPVILTVLLSPQLVLVAVTAGAEVGTVVAGLAAVVVLVASGVAVDGQEHLGAAVWSWATRLVGAAGVAVAVALVVDGVHTV